MDRIFGLVGAGGFGRELLPYINGFDHSSIYLVDDDNRDNNVNGFKLISRENFLTIPDKKKFFNISISDGVIREKISNFFLANQIKPYEIKASNAIVHDFADIGIGAALCDFTIISPNTKIGKFFHFNRFSQVGHDCVIGNYVTFAPNVNCNGNVIIGDHVYIGTGALIKNGTKENPIKIGDGAIIGMGAVVTKNVKSKSVVVGNPAKEIDK
tara:strand:+ start:636 stop:1271 length:636 start_codon:yes stop_codon:yes gene_type:complete